MARSQCFQPKNTEFILDFSCIHAILNYKIILGEIMNIIKTVGTSGQISLGKKYAGQTVILSEIDTGVYASE